MLYRINKRLIRCIVFLLMLSFICLQCSCTFLKKTIYNKIGFSENLEHLENSINNNNWNDAEVKLKASMNSWTKIKPLLQIDIDHDYVNDIEKYFIRLTAYIKTQSKPDSLACVMLIKGLWEDIGKL